MANYNCNACSELREDAPNLVVNGLGTTECASLRNNTGLNPSSGNDDCTDLDNLNDCLIGNMEAEIDAYDVCEWKEYMKKFVPNVWTVLKGIICSVCGLWTNTNNLWKKVNCIANTNISDWTYINTRNNPNIISVDFEPNVVPREGEGSDPERYTCGVRYSLSAAQFRIRMNIKKEFFLDTQDYQDWYDPTKKWQVQALGGTSAIYFKLCTIRINKAKTGIKEVAPNFDFTSAYNGMGVHGYAQARSTSTEVLVDVYLNQVIMWGGAMNENETYSQLAFTWETTVPIETEISFDC